MKLKSQSGNALIEFAFILPILLLIIIGIIEFSILFYNKAIITNASREGARYGVSIRTNTYPTTAQVIDYTKAYCAQSLITFSTTPTDVIVTATPSSASPTFGDKLTVTVNYTYTDLILHNFIAHGKNYALTATTVMTYE